MATEQELRIDVEQNTEFKRIQEGIAYVEYDGRFGHFVTDDFEYDQGEEELIRSGIANDIINQFVTNKFRSVDSD